LDALLSAFVAAGLAEWGDKTQLLAAALAARYARPLPLLAGIFVAALIHALIAGFGGVLVHDYVTIRALSLLVALALLFAGVAGLVSRKAPPILLSSSHGAFAAALVCFFIAEFGDKTQFLTFAIAARFDSLPLAAAGATAGVVAASLPAVLLGDALSGTVPLRGIRLTAAILFLLLACIVAVNAWRLV
jgi:putative Ca2+/H+ antiporter (TMEM165/GDT1 family)